MGRNRVKAQGMALLSHQSDLNARTTDVDACEQGSRRVGLGSMLLELTIRLILKDFEPNATGSKHSVSPREVTISRCEDPAIGLTTYQRENRTPIPDRKARREHLATQVAPKSRTAGRFCGQTRETDTHALPGC